MVKTSVQTDSLGRLLAMLRRGSGQRSSSVNQSCDLQGRVREGEEGLRRATSVVDAPRAGSCVSFYIS